MFRTLAFVVGFLLIQSTAPAVELVKGGKPVATVVVDAPPAPAAKGKKKLPESGDTQAAKIFVEWVQKITDAELPIAHKAPESGPVVYIGAAAVRAGLKIDDIPSVSKEGVQIIADEKRLFIAGQSDGATIKGVCRLLEELGCRYFMDSPLGEVYPRSADLSVKALSLTEKPGLLYRNPKGPSWPGGYWKAWNGGGGTSFGHSHSWGLYIPKDLFEKHPEYFAMGADGKRKNGDWLCTSNPGARDVFAEGVVKSIQGGNTNPSISPPDGRGYCQCETCKAQDDPNVIEPSSGTVAVSNRYADFFDAVGKKVAATCPDSVLSFYCYADYTQPPTLTRKLSPNLCAVIAPIRYCRLHATGNADCPSRKQQVDMIEGWAKLASRLGYYNYMYNLADATLPMFKFTPCQKEFQYLYDRGLTYMTIEVVSNWYIYGPQIYLSTKLAYDPKLDAAAVMQDYYDKFYGPASGYMKAYWMSIDEAMTKLQCHSGGFYGLQSIHTPEFIRNAQAVLKQAAEAAKGNDVYAERVAMHTSGFQNVLDYKAICDAMAKADYAAAKSVYDSMTTRIGTLAAKRQANTEYGTAYLRRFLSKAVDGGVIATAAPNRVVSVLPDRWFFRTDDADTGEAKGFTSTEADLKPWIPVATYTNTLSGQGQSENTILWYRTTFAAPDTKNRLTLLFPEVDGATVDVFVNGQKVEAKSVLPLPKPKNPPPAGAPVAPSVPRRSPFEVDVTGVVKPGDNTVTVKVDNRKISELFLGGILRPVVLIEKK